MKRVLTLSTTCPPAVARGRLIQYCTGIGYRYAEQGNDLVFRRGSWLETLSPRSWKATVTATVAPVPSRPNDVLISYDVHTTGELLLPPEVIDFWDGEIEALEEAVRSGTFEVKGNKDAARGAVGGIWIAMGKMLLALMVTLVVGFAVMLFIVSISFKAKALLPLIGADGVGLVLVALFLAFAAGILVFPLPQIVARAEPMVQSMVRRGSWAYLVILAPATVRSIDDLHAGHPLLIYAVAGMGFVAIVWLWFRRWVQNILPTQNQSPSLWRDRPPDQAPVTLAGVHVAKRFAVPQRETSFIPGRILLALVNVLSGLYPRSDDAVAVVTQAGLRPWQINFSGSISGTWVGILHEAWGQGRTKELLAQPQAEHPDSAALAEAIQAVTDWIASGCPQRLLPNRPLTPAQRNIPWRLIEVLARLYPLDAAAMATMAELSPAYIRMDSITGKRWLNILLTAESQERMTLILAQAQAQYPDDAELAEACQGYADWVAAGRPEPSPSLRPLWATDEPQGYLTPAQLARFSSDVDVLARRCPLPADIAAVAIAAGLDPAAMRFDGTTGLVWESVLCESERLGCTDVVLAKAKTHHPDGMPTGSTGETSDPWTTAVPPVPRPPAHPEPAGSHGAVSSTARWWEELKGLHDALVRLYPLPADAAAIVITSGLDPAHIGFGSCGAVIWTSILDEAQLQGLTGTLMERAQAHHPDDVELAHAIHAYTAGMAA